MNSSLPGLVKVGKTTRTPEERAAELSSATGIPTPFVVAYDRFFEDCGAAEIHIHAILERRGYRETSNREFFRAPVREVIQAVIDAPNPIQEDVDLGGHAGEADITQDRPRDPGEKLVDEALDILHGTNGKLQEPDVAIEILKDGVKIGSARACEVLGQCFADGVHVRRDTRQSLKYYKTALERGSFFSNLSMARIYAPMRHQVNFDLCAKRYSDWFNEAKYDHGSLSEFVHCHGLWLLMALASANSLAYPVQDQLALNAKTLLERFYYVELEKLRRKSYADACKYGDEARPDVTWLVNTIRASRGSKWLAEWAGRVDRLMTPGPLAD